MKKASFLFCCSLFLLFSVFNIHLGTVHASHEQMSTHAEAAALIDVTSGRLLYSQSGDKQMRIASLTKIMTAIVAIEQGKLSDQVSVSNKAFGKEGSSIYLRLGEKMSLHHLLYGLMLRSGNDAAVAIAEHVGGSLEGFAYLMNEKARMIGMDNSKFMNPHGLDEEGHFSTANDMAKLTAYSLKNPIFQEIVKTKVKKVPNSYEKWDHKWFNKNKMLSLYEGADGVKTGYTKQSLRCLVSSATRNEQQLAVVTLNDSDDWIDHSRLLDYGFKYFPHSQLIVKGAYIEGYPFMSGKSFSYPLLEEELSSMTRKIKLYKNTSTNYRFGERGLLYFYKDQLRIGSVPLYEADSPRLELQERSAFHLTQTSSKTSSNYRTILRALLTSLFTLQP